MNKITQGHLLICKNNEPLPGNTIAPPLEVEKEYTAQQVIQCSCGSSRIDVGLKSEYNWVSCYECKAQLPKGDQIHWCHPSRFDVQPSAPAI